MKNGKRIVLFSLFVMNLVDQPAPEVTIEQGIVGGITSADGTFFEYIGIPYATANISNRFKAPLPPPSWDGVYHALTEYTCAQPTKYWVYGTEDCLKVNVYVPARAKRPLPVMVYIHGGAFFLGSGGKLLYGPDFLVKQDVILVTFNYRLGVLGFTCLGTEDAPGNAGLKDQIAAFRWVQKNIAAFGGDPDNVTAFGQSAGGTSMSLLLASNLTDGLFKRAIVQSGTSIANWSINRKPVEIASLIAKELGYDTRDPKEIYNILKDVLYKDLVALKPKKNLGKYLDTELIHLPCVERQLSGEEAVITDLPYNSINKNPRNIPLMYGSTSNEGIFLVAEDTEEILQERNKKYLFATDLKFPTEEEAEKTDSITRKHYFNNEDMTMQRLENVSVLMNDLYFEAPSILEVEMIVKKIDSPVYNYYFNYDGGRNFLKSMSGLTNMTGASHADELMYIFNGMIWPYKIQDKDARMIEIMTKMWTNFAKYGDPTPEGSGLPVKWKPSTKTELNFLYIDEELKMGPLPNPVGFNLWKRVYEKYRNLEINYYGD